MQISVSGAGLEQAYGSGPGTDFFARKLGGCSALLLEQAYGSGPATDFFARKLGGCSAPLLELDLALSRPVVQMAIALASSRPCVLQLPCQKVLRLVVLAWSKRC